MDAIIVALVALVAGALIAGFGTRLFFALLPLWGFLVGFALGADLMATIGGAGFLTTLAGWAAGLVVGIVFALLAGLTFYAAVLILGIGLGANLGAGILVAIGFEPGLLTLLAGAAGGAAVGILVLLIDVPTLLVAAFTGYGGTGWMIAGVWLMFGRIHVEDLHGGGAIGALRTEPLAMVLVLAIGTLAFVFQGLDLRRLRIDAIDRAGYRY